MDRQGIKVENIESNFACLIRVVALKELFIAMKKKKNIFIEKNQILFTLDRGYLDSPIPHK
jgi:DNA polymerase III sliding clamp (beta) subunit (PCNA family)